MTNPVQTPVRRPPFGEPELFALFAVLKVQAHPIMRLPTLAWVQELMVAQPATWQALLAEALRKRQERIANADADPLWWGWELEPWADSDRLLMGAYVSPKGYRPPAAEVLGIFGGNRASKSVYAVKRACQTAELFPKCKIAILSESEESSIGTVQARAWEFLKPRYTSLNAKRDSVFKINHSQAGGFTDRKLVLPNGSEIHFLTYNQNPGDYEGWEFGAPTDTYNELAPQLRAEGRFVPANIGVVADESMPLSWLNMFSRRLKFRRAKLLWPFTPVKGITPAIKELAGTTARTIESRPSELLPRQNFPDIPAGEMPYVRECAFPGVKAMAIYYFTMFNAFGPERGRTYYDEVKLLCEGKVSEYKERIAYGYARDSVNKAFPKFGAVNIVKRNQLPAIGTNYFFTDPAGTRNWMSLWVRVTPGKEPSFYIYRDWPDAQTFGEWAVPTEREVNDQNRAGWDGDQGPAQHGMGFGIVKYKQVFLECERIKGPETTVPGEIEAWRAKADPYHVRLWNTRKGGEISEDVAERYVDPRAAKSEKQAEESGTCIMDQFAEAQRDAKGMVTGPVMDLVQASGVNIEEGLMMVNELLDYNEKEPMVRILNQPHLFVSEDCQQVIWAMANYTGRAGDKGACKDPIDLVRYLALAELEYIDPVHASGRKGQGF